MSETLIMQLPPCGKLKSICVSLSHVRYFINLPSTAVPPVQSNIIV
jgi:hypothetical protein